MKQFIDRVKKISENEINKKIFNSSAWILLGNVLSKATLLISTIIISRILVKEEYGQFGILKSTIMMFASFAGLELAVTATKYISQYKDSNKQKVEKIIGLSNFITIIISTIIALLTYVFSKEIAGYIKAPQLSLGIKISSFVIFLSALNSIQTGIFSGLQRFKELSINVLISGIISSLGMILGAKYFGLIGVLVFFGSNYVILFVLNYLTLRKIFYKDFKINFFKKSNFSEFSIIWKFSLPAILAALMVGPVIWVCNYFLVIQENGYDQMAFFDIANQWRNTILFIPMALSQIALPMLSAAVDDDSKYKVTYYKNLKLNIYISIIMVVGFVAISPLIVITYGKDYQGALYPLIIMLVTTGLVAVNNVIGQVIASKNKMWLGFFVNFIWGIVLIILSYIFIVLFKLGAIGISLAYLLSYVSHTMVQFLIIKKVLKI